MTIGETELEAGPYAILTKPGADSWAVHFYPFKENGWGSYREAIPAVAIDAAPIQNSVFVESLLLK